VNKLSICIATAVIASVTTGTANAATTISIIKKAEASICATLKDCESARFRNETVKMGADGTPIVCGEVNAKNSYGGYGGFQGFIYLGGGSTITAESFPDLFNEAWPRTCVN
jgi:hypothetical protein